MASLTFSTATTVAALKSEFNAAFGATLRVYNGGKVANDSVTLGELGLSADGPFECRSSLTVDSFIERMKSEHNLKVKVYTCDGWVAVLGGLTLESAGKVKKNAVKADMESMIAYQRSDKSASDEYSVIKNEDGGYFVSINGVVQDNAKAAMRQIAEAIGFDYDPNWTTRQFGSKLAAAIGGNTPSTNQAQMPFETSLPIATEADNVENEDEEEDDDDDEFAENVEYDGMMFSVIDSNACLDLILDDRERSSLVVPDIIVDDGGRKYPVTTVALGESDFKEIVFPKGLETISGWAFESWDGKSIPKFIFKNDNIVFQDGVFLNKEKTNLFNAVFAAGSKVFSIPEGVTEIEEKAFSTFKDLERIEFPSSTRVICCGFEDLKSLKEVIIYAKESDITFYDELGDKTDSSAVFPSNAVIRYETKGSKQTLEEDKNYFDYKGFTYLKNEDGTFVDLIWCNASATLPKLVVPDHVFDERGRCFPVEGYQLKSVFFKEIILPKTLRYVSSNAFSDWDRKSAPRISISGENITYENGCFFTYDKGILMNTVFASISKEYKVPEGVRRIFPKAFDSHADSLERLILPKSIVYDGIGQHYGLINLKEVFLYADLSRAQVTGRFPDSTRILLIRKTGVDKIKYLFEILKTQDTVHSSFAVDKQTIEKVFSTTDQSTKEGVLARLTLIDSLYSTQMGKRYYGLDELAEVISSFSNLKSAVKEFLLSYDSSVFSVDVKVGGSILTRLIKGKRVVSLFDEKYGIDKDGDDSGIAISLITKYLYFLTNGGFPIYDSIAVSILPKLWLYCGFDPKEMPSLKTSLKPGDDNYGNDIIIRFVKAINAFLNKIGKAGDPKMYDYLDRILWFTGKICRGNLSLIIDREQYENLAKLTREKNCVDNFVFNIADADLSELAFLEDNPILNELFILAKEIGPIS